MLRARLALCVLLCMASSQLSAQVLALAGGETIRAATKHDVVRVEVNFPWKRDIWQNGSWRLDLNHAVSGVWFHDENDVYAASWAPNLVLRRETGSNFYPYIQAGFGVAVLSEDYFESQDDDPTDDGTTNMGSHGQFESSLAIGFVSGRFGMRAKVYHYSNAELASENDGIDVAELGFLYYF